MTIAIQDIIVLGSFYKHGVTLIPAWISNHMPSKMWDEITFSIPKLQRCNRWSLGMYKLQVCFIPHSCNTISYPLFADADTGIYPHAASQYHARPKAKRGIAMLSVDKFPYPRKQTRGNEFIPCSNNICDILKRFRSFKIPAITLIWPKSPYKQCY